MGKFKGFQRESPLFMDRPKYKKIGYARSSSATSKFGLEAEIAALKEDHCDQIFAETVSTKFKATERPQFKHH